MKRKTVIPFTRNAEAHSDEAFRLFDKGALFSALREAETAIGIDPDCLDYRFLQADIYCEMGLHEQAIESALKVLAYDTTVTECDGIVIRSLAALGRVEPAVFYFHLAVRYGEESEEMADVRDSMRDLLDVRPHFRLVDDEADNAALCADATKALREGHFDEARAQAIRVAETSAHFPRALILCAAACLAAGAIPAAVRRAQRALECAATPEERNAALAVLYRTELASGERDTARATFEKLDFSLHSDLFCAERVLDAALDCPDPACAEAALALVSACRDGLPYDVRLLKAEAAFLSRLGRYRDASSALLDALTLDPLDYGAMRLNATVQSGAPIRDPFSLSPDDEAAAVNGLVEWAAADESTCELYAKRSYKIAELRYVLQHESVSPERATDLLVSILRSATAEIALRDLLVLYDMSDFGKRAIVTALSLYGSDNVELQKDDVLWYIDLRAPSKLGNPKDVRTRAWAYAVGSLSLAAVDFSAALRRAFNRLAAVRLPSDTSANALANTVVLFLLYAKKLEIVSKERLVMFAGEAMPDDALAERVAIALGAAGSGRKKRGGS